MAFGDDELSAEEQTQLDSFMTTDQTVPPDPDNQMETGGEAAPAPAPAPAAPAPAPVDVPADAPAPEPGAAPAPAPAAPAPAQTEDERFAAWQALNKDKTPEEIARLAFQQTNRAAAAGFEARKAGETLKQINDRLTSAAERAAERRGKLAVDRAAFEQRLAEDPDAALKEVYERLAAQEDQNIDTAEFSAKQDAALALASAAIPDFNARAPEVFGFAAEMGYSKDELQSISDGRDLVVLALASLAGRLIKGEVIDLQGNMLAAPQPVAEIPTDPRLTAPRPVGTLSSTPGRGPGGGGAAPSAQAIDALKLSDAEFDRLSASGELDQLMKQLSE